MWAAIQREGEEEATGVAEEALESGRREWESENEMKVGGLVTIGSRWVEVSFRDEATVYEVHSRSAWSL